MKISFKTTSIVIIISVLAMSCAQQAKPAQIQFDTSYSAPIYWKAVEEGLWGLRFNVPRSLHEVEDKKSLWIHEGDQLRFIVDFGNSPSPESLKRKPNYSELRLVVNGLPALVCTYDQPKGAAGSLNRVAALVFLENRKTLGGGGEPWYRVEYSSEEDRATALQILQTVRFYDS